jgi:hypothetical protein
MSYTFICKFSCILPCSYLCSRLHLQGLAFLARSIHVAWIDNQQSGGVVTTRFQSFVQSLHHQCQDLQQSTYLYLVEDREPTPHHSGPMDGSGGGGDNGWSSSKQRLNVGRSGEVGRWQWLCSIPAMGKSGQGGDEWCYF